MKKLLVSILVFVAVSSTLIGCAGKPVTTEQQPVISEADSSNNEVLTADEVKLIASTHAGVNYSAITDEKPNFVKVALNNQTSIPEYEIIMEQKDAQYVYKINALTGKILTSSFEPIVVSSSTSETDTSTATVKVPTPIASSDTTPESSTPVSQASTASATANEITLEKAKEIALNHAGLKVSDVTFLKGKTDYENGKKIYEIEFYSGSTEYDYDIDIQSGKILSYDYDINDFSIPANNTTNDNTGSSTDIGETKAKEIALAKVPGATNNHIRIKKDYEDGHLVYEGEIIYGEIEYEFEINASSGVITSWEKESIYD